MFAGLVLLCCALPVASTNTRLLAAIPATASTPFGAPWPIPGRIESVDFDHGGQNVAYFDSSAGNTGGEYRPTDVDIERSPAGWFDVGWVGPGEWLRYSVAVEQTGTYSAQFKVASPAGGGVFHLEMSGVDVTGPLVVPPTGGWQSWTTVFATVVLGQGVQQMTLVVDADGANAAFGNFGPIEFVAAAGGVTPYTGSATAIPGTIATANFDNGPWGQAYADTSGGNYGGAYRPTDVDIESAAIGGYNVGWVDAGEWLSYTVNVAQSGAYTATFFVAAPAAGGSFHLEMNRVNVTGPLTVPYTGGWQSWQTVSATVSLSAGQQEARLVFDTTGNGIVGNFARIDFSPATSPPPAGPFAGTPVNLPGVVDAAHFDHGQSGTSFFDTTAGNAGGAYRPTDVDLEPSADGGYNVGWTDAGEWMNYTVNVTEAGAYVVQMRVATTMTGRSLHIGFNGSSVWTQLFANATGAWQTWTTLTLPVVLNAGVQQITIYFDTGGLNLGRMTIDRESAPPPPPHHHRPHLRHRRLLQAQRPRACG